VRSRDRPPRMNCNRADFRVVAAPISWKPDIKGSSADGEQYIDFTCRALDTVLEG
jgi:hypothetical protein